MLSWFREACDVYNRRDDVVDHGDLAIDPFKAFLLLVL
jgi:hypothetical protein